MNKLLVGTAGAVVAFTGLVFALTGPGQRPGGSGSGVASAPAATVAPATVPDYTVDMANATVTLHKSESFDSDGTTVHDWGYDVQWADGAIGGYFVATAAGAPPDAMVVLNANYYTAADRAVFGGQLTQDTEPAQPLGPWTVSEDLGNGDCRWSTGTVDGDAAYSATAIASTCAEASDAAMAIEDRLTDIINASPS